MIIYPGSKKHCLNFACREIQEHFWTLNPSFNCKIVHITDEEHQVSIEEAFKHTKSKKLVDDVTSQRKMVTSQKQSPVKKKLISAADFFGSSAVKQSEKTTLAVKRKAVWQSQN